MQKELHEGECTTDRSKQTFSKFLSNKEFVMLCFTVKAYLLKCFMRFVRIARREFHNAAALHSHKPVFNHINKSAAVCSAELIQLFNKSNAVHFLTVNGGRHTFFKMNCNISRFVGSLFRRNAHLKDLVILWLICRVFKIKSLMLRCHRFLSLE